MNTGVIGYGYWGPNLVRNFMAQNDCLVTPLPTAVPKDWHGAETLSLPEDDDGADDITPTIQSRPSSSPPPSTPTIPSPGRRSSGARTCSSRNP
jgi:hypothetical protein